MSLALGHGSGPWPTPSFPARPMRVKSPACCERPPGQTSRLKIYAASVEILTSLLLESNPASSGADLRPGARACVRRAGSSRCFALVDAFLDGRSGVHGGAALPEAPKMSSWKTDSHGANCVRTAENPGSTQNRASSRFLSRGFARVYERAFGGEEALSPCFGEVRAAVGEMGVLAAGGGGCPASSSVAREEALAGMGAPLSTDVRNPGARRAATHGAGRAAGNPGLEPRGVAGRVRWRRIPTSEYTQASCRSRSPWRPDSRRPRGGCASPRGSHGSLPENASWQGFLSTVCCGWPRRRTLEQLALWTYAGVASARLPRGSRARRPWIGRIAVNVARPPATPPGRLEAQGALLPAGLPVPLAGAKESSRRESIRLQTATCPPPPTLLEPF